MLEIQAIPANGLNIVSLFSGCGGSCLGFRMMGFNILWANEFIPAAREVYRLNNPQTIIDERDIRHIKPEEILQAIGKKRGEIDLVEGSPPCASFSTAGKREKSWGKVRQYSDTRQRVDDLFFEFARLVEGLQPKVFVAENVSGLVKGKAKGYFKEILARLKSCGYRVRARLLDAQWLGVPQMRQRIIFIGVRSDLARDPVFPKPLPYRYSVREAIGVTLRSQSYAANGWTSDEGPAAAIPASGQYFVKREAIVGIEEANDYSDHVFYSPDRPMGTIQAQRPVRVSVLHAYRDKRGAFGNDGDITNTPAPTILSDSVGTHWIVGIGTKDGVRSANKPAPSVLTPGRQYTTSELTIVETESDISRYAIGREWDNLAPGEQSDKYFQLVKAPIDGPCPTVTQRGGDNTVASVTHPIEKRKFTIAELKRICAFPDDFQLTGTYAQQWERLGRAVPPVMMSHIARVIRDEILCSL